MMPFRPQAKGIGDQNPCGDKMHNSCCYARIAGNAHACHGACTCHGLCPEATWLWSKTAILLALRLKTSHLQMWDINVPPPEELGEPYNIAVATNVLHTGANLAGAHLI